MRFFLTLLIFLLIAGCGADTGTRQVGRAVITSVSPQTANRGETDLEGRIYGTNLEGMTSVSLGDGVDIQQANILSPSEIYIFFSVSPDAAPGPRTVTIFAAEGVFTLDQAFVVGDNRIPKASFTVTPPSGYRSTVFRFDASKSEDPDGAISSYRWDFGDRNSATGKTLTHKFNGAGAFVVKLTVTDNRGAVSVAERFVDVAVSKPPEAQFAVTPASGDLTTVFRFDASGSRDPDGRIAGYSWNFNDGAAGAGQTTTHKFSRTGVFSVTLTVFDNSHLSSTVTRSVSVDSSGGGDDDDGGGGGGGGGSCDANNFNTNYFMVMSVSGNTITADQSFRECPGLCGEVRRPGGAGIREFVGDIVTISGPNITINTGSLPASTRPEAGERLNIVWRSCGS